MVHHRVTESTELKALKVGPDAPPESDPLTAEIIGAAIEVHRTLGPGLLESTYVRCLERELESREVRVRREVEVPVSYKGLSLDCGYRIDLLVEECVIVEVKAVEKVHPVHEAQLLTYMRLASKSTGLIINFHTRLLKDGITRRVI